VVFADSEAFVTVIVGSWLKEARLTINLSRYSSAPLELTIIIIAHFQLD